MKKDRYDVLCIAKSLSGIEGWCREGASYKDIADILGVTSSTIWNWRKKHPEFADATRHGRKIYDGLLLNTAFKLATGYTESVTDVRKVTKQRYEPNIRKVLTIDELEIVTYEKTVEPSVRMLRFMLMNRLPERYGGRRQKPADQNIQVTFRGIKDEEVKEHLD